jgi:nicotinamide phosphoribosyltransferase
VDIICGDWNFEEHGDQCRNDGVVKLLWDRFGGTVTSKGFKLLDSHVGVIYGDAITYPRAAEIGARLAVNGFAMQPVLGVGSFTYQYVTRDTFGFAMKATYAVVDGEERDLFKDPVTDSGTKRSAKGRLAVHRKIADLNGADPEYVLVQQATPADEELCEMVTVLVKGAVVNFETFETVVERLGARVLVPTHTYHY